MHDVGNRQVHRPWWRSLAWMPGLLVLLALISVVGHIGEQERLLALVERSRPAWLLAAAALQAATYFSAAGVWQRVLWKAGCWWCGPCGDAASGCPRPWQPSWWT